MHLITAGELRTVLHYRMLIERLRQAFRGDCASPPAQHYTIPTYGSHDATLTVIPAWQTGRRIGVALTTVFPDNPKRELPAMSGSYLVHDGKTGVLQAVIDGYALKIHRAAATSALAASYLARPDAERFLVIGTGSLASHLIEAYAVVLPIREVLVWGRDRSKADRIAARFRRGAFRVMATTDLEGAVAGAHVVSCATSATDPVLCGAWLMPGAHVDLVGSVTPKMREADDEVVRRSRVFVDSREECWRETGDLREPLTAGVLTPEDVAGDLFDLTRGERSGRRYYDQITLFKSVGVAIGDLVTAELAVEMVAHNETLR